MLKYYSETSVTEVSISQEGGVYIYPWNGLEGIKDPELMLIRPKDRKRVKYVQSKGVLPGARVGQLLLVISTSQDDVPVIENKSG